MQYVLPCQELPVPHKLEADPKHAAMQLLDLFSTTLVDQRGGTTLVVEVRPVEELDEEDEVEGTQHNEASVEILEPAQRPTKHQPPEDYQLCMGQP